MSYKALTSTHLALKNLKRKPLRTAGLIIIVGLLSFVLFGGSILSVNLKNGLDSMKSRFGADLMIIPLDAEADVEGILIKGEPNYFYFDKSLVAEITDIQGIESSSLQFYLTSSNQGCCDIPVQFIGFDPDTDFTVQPWIEKVYNGKVNDGALIVGSDINVENGSTLQFFDKEYPVAAKLEETGTGLDQAVFANMNTLKDLFSAAQEKGLSFTENVNPETSVSSIMIKIKEGYDADEVIHNIRVKTDGLQIVKTKSMLSGIAETLGAFIWFIYILAAMLLLLALIVLSVVFSITVNERKKEFSIIRALGGTKRFVLAVIFKESLGISISGGIAGVLIAAIVLFPFNTYIADNIGLPYLNPNISVIIMILALSLIVSFASGPIAAIRSAVRISKAEAYLTMCEEE